MKINELMTSLVHTCSPQDSLAHAARKMWDHDCGALPVVDRSGRVGAMITDRDICMAAFAAGTGLKDLRVADSMSKSLVTCAPTDELSVAATRMAEHQVHRLPVVDAQGKLQGILALNDLATAGQDSEVAREALTALRGVCRRSSDVAPVGKVAAGKAAAGKAEASKAKSTESGSS